MGIQSIPEAGPTCTMDLDFDEFPGCSSPSTPSQTNDAIEFYGSPPEDEIFEEEEVGFGHPSKNICVELPPSTLVSPKSVWGGFTAPAPPARERFALDQLMLALEAQGGHNGDFIEFEVDQFSFYVNSKVYPHEMRPLHHFATKKAHDKNFYFDGIVSLGDLKFHLTKVEVVELPIGNYGSSHHTVGGHIWVRSWRNANKEIYYRFKKPAVEYERFYTPFLWVADLTKHVVDFCSSMMEKRQGVSFLSFKHKFSQWAEKMHSTSPSFRRWRTGHSSDDFRTSVMANIDFIWKEMNGVLDPGKVERLQLFRETKHFDQWKENIAPAITKIREGKSEVAATIVTPYIMECFGHMILGKVLKVGGLDSEASESIENQTGRPAVERPGPNPAQPQTKSRGPSFLSPEAVDGVVVGDVISTPRDMQDATDTKWEVMASKDGLEDDRWFGLVQKVHVSAENGPRSFDVTWFYRPVETPCCMMRYPWANELFLSDHCTCEDGSDARVKGTEILGTHEIDWFGTPDVSTGEFFVRQTYAIEKRRWTTLDRSHLRCTHDSPRLEYKAGDTVIATLSSTSTFSEAYEVVKIFKQDETRFVRLRKLPKRRDVDPSTKGIAPNELVYTEQFIVVKPDKIVGKCFVRSFVPDTPIPVPYNRGGTGNLFFITSRLEESHDGVERVVPFAGDFPATIHQGFDPGNHRIPKLKGLDLFCGSGNFGRGLEEGGVVDMRWANDVWDRAIHTYMANAPNPRTTRPFLGSVDNLFQLAMEGKFSDNVPRPGEVDFISGGSPCPGFSLLTTNKATLEQFKNRSLVASFASFVDFYRPKFGVLENVCTIVQSKSNRSEDVLSQLFCALVGLGYQAQLIMGDAWSYGAPQSRSRVFLYFAAPGFRLPEAPRPSHSHFPKAKRHNLGKMCNGEPFVGRIFGPTPFKYVSAAEATADLPRIHDAVSDTCVSFPDHRLSVGVTYERRQQFSFIPTHPSGLGFAKAWNQGKGVMTPGERALFPNEGTERVSPTATGWSRIRPTDVFPTITTACNPTDARLGAGLHWFEDRPISIQEVRRAQGFPDEEVLLANVIDQWVLVGNSVARQMATVLGLQFREAWLGSLHDDACTGIANAVGQDVPTRRSSTAYSRGQSKSLVDVSETDTGSDPAAKRSGSTPMTTLSAESAEGRSLRKRRSESAVVGDHDRPRKVSRRGGSTTGSSARSSVSRQSRSGSSQLGGEMMQEADVGG